MIFKRIRFLALGAILALFLIACGSNHNPASDKHNPTTDNHNPVADSSKSGAVQLPNPFQPCDTLEAAEEMAGFDVTLPQSADRLEVIENEMIQALYGEDGTEMLIRKAPGSEDISGDYHEYSQITIVDGVTLKGADGHFSLALWTDGGYTYSISVGNACSEADMTALVDSVK